MNNLKELFFLASLKLDLFLFNIGHFFLAWDYNLPDADIKGSGAEA